MGQNHREERTTYHPGGTNLNHYWSTLREEFITTIKFSIKMHNIKPHIVIKVTFAQKR